MSNTRAAIRYAKAILELAKANNNANAVQQDMILIYKTITENKELEYFIANPVLSNQIKKNALVEVFSSISHVTNDLFKLLFENKRFELLQEIAHQFIALFDEANGVEVAKVTTAEALTPELETQILQKIASISNKKVTIENTIDPALIGGFILRIGDMQYNASIANKLQALKRELSN